MPSGVVYSFNEEDGYGFVTADDGERYFVHHRSIEMKGFRTLSPGEKVLFDIVVGKRGPEATHVRKL